MASPLLAMIGGITLFFLAFIAAIALAIIAIQVGVALAVAILCGARYIGVVFIRTLTRAKRGEENG